MAEEVFSTDCPDLQAFIKSLDLLDDKISAAVVDAMGSAANTIVNEQKRLVQSGHPRLVRYIKKGTLRVSKKGSVYVDCGYLPDAFNSVEDGTNMGVYGVSVEFGRPGTGKRSGTEMKQKRHGKEVTVKKGRIQPQSHIIRGFENKVNEASNAVIEAVNRVLDEAEK